MGADALDTKRVKALSSLLLVFAMITAPQAKADSTREFVTSCVYGTIAGTLVGVASLAFTNQPGENLRNVARGASLGLYAGILLGFYVTQVVSDGDELQPQPLQGEPPPAEELPPEGRLIRPRMELVLNPRTQIVDGAVFKAAITF